MTLRRRERRGTDRRRSQRSDTVNRRQCGIVAGERDIVECVRLACGERPKMFECRLRSHIRNRQEVAVRWSLKSASTSINLDSKNQYISNSLLS
jgi:hypothetical protein